MYKVKGNVLESICNMKLPMISVYINEQESASIYLKGQTVNVFISQCQKTAHTSRFISDLPQGVNENIQIYNCGCGQSNFVVT